MCKELHTACPKVKRAKQNKTRKNRALIPPQRSYNWLVLAAFNWNYWQFFKKISSHDIPQRFIDMLFFFPVRTTGEGKKVLLCGDFCDYLASFLFWFLLKIECLNYFFFGTKLIKLEVITTYFISTLNSNTKKFKWWANTEHNISIQPVKYK